MKKLNYFIENNILTIQVAGEMYKFKIEDPAAAQTVEFLFQDILQTEEQFGSKKDNIEPIVKILLTSLSIADKYLDIQRKYNDVILNDRDKNETRLSRNIITWPETNPNPIVTNEEIDMLMNYK